MLLNQWGGLKLPEKDSARQSASTSTHLPENVVLYRKLTPADKPAYALLAQANIVEDEPLVVYGGECWISKAMDKQAPDRWVRLLIK